MIKHLYKYIAIIFILNIYACSDVKKAPADVFAPQMYSSVPYNPDQPNNAFKDGKTAQNPVEGTIPQGFTPFKYQKTIEDYELAGKELFSPLDKNEQNLKQGKALFVKMCSHCHGQTGMGDGLVVTNGRFPAPPAYNSASLRNLPEGKMFVSITYGKNAMPSHASVLSNEERWKIIQYVQTLQK